MWAFFWGGADSPLEVSSWVTNFGWTSFITHHSLLKSTHIWLAMLAGRTTQHEFNCYLRGLDQNTEISELFYWPLESSVILLIPVWSFALNFRHEALHESGKQLTVARGKLHFTVWHCSCVRSNSKCSVGGLFFLSTWIIYCQGIIHCTGLKRDVISMLGRLHTLTSDVTTAGLSWTADEEYLIWHQILICGQKQNMIKNITYRVRAAVIHVMQCWFALKKHELSSVWYTLA